MNSTFLVRWGRRILTIAEEYHSGRPDRDWGESVGIRHTCPQCGALGFALGDKFRKRQRKCYSNLLSTEKAEMFGRMTDDLLRQGCSPEPHDGTWAPPPAAPERFTVQVVRSADDRPSKSSVAIVVDVREVGGAEGVKAWAASLPRFNNTFVILAVDKEGEDMTPVPDMYKGVIRRPAEDAKEAWRREAYGFWHATKAPPPGA